MFILPGPNYLRSSHFETYTTTGYTASFTTFLFEVQQCLLRKKNYMMRFRSVFLLLAVRYMIEILNVSLMDFLWDQEVLCDSMYTYFQCVSCIVCRL